jgi:hypothetical protein
MHACMHACTETFARIYIFITILIYTHIHKTIPNQQDKSHTYIHTYIHTHMHTLLSEDSDEPPVSQNFEVSASKLSVGDAVLLLAPKDFYDKYNAKDGSYSALYACI